MASTRSARSSGRRAGAEVEDALAEPAAFGAGLEAVAADAGGDVCAGDLEADPVGPLRVVGDAGELEGAAFTPAQPKEALPDEDGVGVDGVEGVDDGELVGQAGDGSFGVVDVADLGGAGCVVGLGAVHGVAWRDGST
jgi:hypothetical protein